MDDSFEILNKDKKKKSTKKQKNGIEIMPKKDWHIVFNEHDIKIKEGEKIVIPEMFFETLKTEKVI